MSAAMSPASPLAICRYGAEYWLGKAVAAAWAWETPAASTRAGTAAVAKAVASRVAVRRAEAWGVLAMMTSQFRCCSS